MASKELNEPLARVPIPTAAFRGWLGRTEDSSWFEYHRGLLILDRSPASELADNDRRALAKIADAVFQEADSGQVHLVQRRNGPFDFSYLAIKRSVARDMTVMPRALPVQMPAAA